MAKCVVSYLDLSGIRHQVEVEAGSMYEAAALAIRAFREHDCEPGALSQLDIEIRTAVTHTLTVKKLHEWLNGGAKTPKDVVMKDRLRELVG